MCIICKNQSKALKRIKEYDSIDIEKICSISHLNVQRKIYFAVISSCTMYLIAERCTSRHPSILGTQPFCTDMST